MYVEVTIIGIVFQISFYCALPPSLVYKDGN